MQAIAGFYDPEGILAGGSFAIMVGALYPSASKQAHIVKTAFASIAIENSYVANDANPRFGFVGEPLCERQNSLEDLMSSDSVDSIAELRGSFAIASVDEQAAIVTLISDHTGSYPLYIAEYKSAVIFSTQIKAILSIFPVKVSIDTDSVATMLSIGEMIGNRTLVREVSVIPAGSRIRIGANGIATEQYWTYLHESDSSVDYNDLRDEVGHTLGIAHNFAASVNDRASVMDYPHPYITLGANGEIDLYSSGARWLTESLLYFFNSYSTPNSSSNHKTLKDWEYSK